MKTARVLAIPVFCLLMVGISALSSCILVRGRTGDRILFPLAPHADILSSCETCHEDIASHDVTSETRRSLEQACFECHGDKKEDCTYCHTDPASAGVFPEKDRHLTFSHESHLVRTQGDCSQCHPSPHESDVHPTTIPAHAQCFSCHQMQKFYDRLECGNCHEDLYRYSLSPYDNFTHAADWVQKEHAMFVRDPQNARKCAQCHEQPFCSECHFDSPMIRQEELNREQPFRSWIHPGDFITRHQWEVRADSASCLRCHGQKFCSDCHDSRGITQKTSAKFAGGYRFHGPGVLIPSSPDFHGTAARRDVVSCAACHTDGKRGDCLECHAMGSPSFVAVNPHPRHFKSRLSRTGAPVCRLCHVR